MHAYKDPVFLIDKWLDNKKYVPFHWKINENI